MSGNGFQYLPLDCQANEFRLLTLLPGSLGTLLHCRLSTANLIRCSPYNALSYVWGDPSSSNDPGNILILDGHRFQATANLISALRHLRPPDGAPPISLWVDAVCINQGDLNERSQQVSMMQDIYASAERVIIWIGEEGDGSGVVFDSIPAIAEQDQQDNLESHRQSRLSLMRECSSFFFGLVGRRTWFSRLWILQELAMAQHDPLVVCGRKSVSWSMLIKAWSDIAREAFSEIGMVRKKVQHFNPKGSGDMNKGTTEPLRNSPDTDGDIEVLAKLKIDVLNDLREAMRSQGGESLMKLLMISRTSQSTDPRDRIYGLLGMIKTEGKSSHGITVDYCKPTAAVYTDAMSHIFSRGDGPYFLSGVFLPGVSAAAPHINSLPPITKQSNLPSWVPDFSRQTAEQTTRTSGIHFHPPAGAGASGVGADCKNGKRLDDERTLQVEGLLVDKIDLVISLGASVDSCIDKLDALEAAVSAAKQRPCQFTPTIAPLIEQFKRKEPLWRTLISNKRLRSGYDPAPSSYETMYLSLLKHAAMKGDLHSHARNPPENDYKLCLEQNIGKCALFVSKGGFVGTCVPDSCVGDTVAVIFGSPVPFILRPAVQHGSEAGKDQQTYSLVGASYVGGIMSGEMVDELYCEDLMDSTTFLIR